MSVPFAYSFVSRGEMATHTVTERRARSSHSVRSTSYGLRGAKCTAPRGVLRFVMPEGAGTEPSSSDFGGVSRRPWAWTGQTRSGGSVGPRHWRSYSPLLQAGVSCDAHELQTRKACTCHLWRPWRPRRPRRSCGVRNDRWLDHDRRHWKSCCSKLKGARGHEMPGAGSSHRSQMEGSTGRNCFPKLRPITGTKSVELESNTTCGCLVMFKATDGLIIGTDDAALCELKCPRDASEHETRGVSGVLRTLLP